MNQQEINALNIVSAFCKHLNIDRPYPYIGKKWAVRTYDFTFIFVPAELTKPLRFYHALKKAVRNNPFKR
jgi:hypothetical protein